MSLKQLIKNQTIIIDDHKRGSGEIKNWDNTSTDIHIDKKTNFPIEGKKQQEVRIRIPINSDRSIQIEAKGNKKITEIPKRLRREIQQAFENKKSRERFMADVIETLQNYDTILSSEQRVEQVLRNISRHFDLEWTDDRIVTYKNDILELYTRYYTDGQGRQFYITIDRKKIEIGENNGFGIQQRNIL